MFVTDNGTVFTSDEFNSFYKQNGIHHVRLTPYHAASNDLEGRAVQLHKEDKRVLLKLMYHVSCYSTILLLTQPLEFHLLQC